MSSFAQFLFNPWDCGNAHPEYLFRISSDGDRFRFEKPGLTTYCENERSVALELEYSLTLFAQHLLERHTQIHGACFGLDGEGALVVGAHGSGKTTLALTAISSGMIALCDDICPVESDFRRMLGFPRPFKATADTWALTPRPVPDDCPVFHAADDVTYVFFHEPPEKYYAGSLTLRHIIFPIRREGPTELETLEEMEAFQLLITQGFNYIRQGSLSIARSLSSMLRNAPPIRIYYENHWEAIDVIRGLLM